MMAKNYVSKVDVKKGVNETKLPGGLFKYIKGFRIINLEDGQKVNLRSDGNEVGIVILRGKCDIGIDGKIYKGLGSRESVFDGHPTGVYVPIGKEYEVISRGVELAVCESKCETASEFAIIEPKDLKLMQPGKDNWQRDVRMIIGPSSPSINLLVGETLNPAGNWSGTPAHKHEEHNLPSESLHEELYYFKVDRPQGFGIKRFYSYEKGINDLIYIEDNSVTFMPWGYHQIVAGPGYTLYYLFFLSGEGKELIGSIDENHKWLLD